MDILNFLPFDEYYTKNIDITIKEKDIYIIDGINITSKESQIIKEVEKSKIYKYFKDLEDKYLEIFTKKIKGIENLNVFFSLLPDDNFNYSTSVLINNWIKKNINSLNENKYQNFKEDINRFISIMTKNANELLEDLIKFFDSHLKKFCSELYIYILNNNKDIRSKTKEQLVNHFIIKNERLELIQYFLENLIKKEDDIINFFYENIKNYIINLNEDFSVKKKTIKLKLFELLLSHKSDFIDNRKNDFLKNTVEKCKYIINDIKDKFIKYKNIIDTKHIYLDKDRFIKRLKNLYIFSGEDKLNNIDNQINEIYNDIITVYTEWKSKIEKLEEYSEYYKIFFNYSFSKEKKELESFIKFLKDSTLNDLITRNKTRYEKYQANFDEAEEKIFLYKNSLIFQSIYEFNQKRIIDELSLLKESYKDFKNSIKILNTNPEQIQNNEYIHYFLEIGYKYIDNIKTEINLIIKKYNINILDEQKEKLLNAIYLLIHKKDLKHIISSLISLIVLFKKDINIHKCNSITSILDQCEKKEDLLTELIEFKNILDNKISPSKIKNIIDYLNNKFNQINFNDKDFQSKILPFFLEYDNNKDSFNFLKTVIKLKDINYMKDFLPYNDENEISLDDLNDLKKAKLFLNDLEINDNQESLIKQILEGILDNKKCGNCLKNVLKKLDIFQRFLDQIKFGDGSFINKIDNIMETSNFTIMKNIVDFQIIIKYMEKPNDRYQNIIIEKDINEHDLNNLYNRAITAKINDKMKNVIQKFTKLYKQIKKLIRILKKLYCSYGYPIIEKIFIFCNKNIISCEYDKKKYNLNELYDYFLNIKNTCKDKYSKAVENSFEINLFYGKQLYLIYSCIKSKNYNEIKDLMRSISNGLIKKFDEKFNFKNDILDPYDKMIQNVKDYINRQLKFNGQKINQIFKENQITIKNFKYNGGIYYYSHEKDIEFFLSNLIYNMCGKLPSSNNVLICNKDTTFEEIQCIINKSIYLKYNNIFIIANCNLLSAYSKRKLIKELKEKSTSVNFENLLVIIFSDNDSDFHKLITRIEKINSIDLKEINAPNKIKNFPNVEIVQSDGCGYGKTSYILESKKATIIHFPVGGDLNRKYLEERIEKEICNTLNSNNYILYVNISQTKNIELLKEFLFKLLIFKKCDFNDNVKYFGPNVEIKIEIPNDFIDYILNIKFLSLFTKKNINIKKLNLSDNIRIVSTFLSKYESKELSKSNINIEKDCNPGPNYERLIDRFININSPNFYQKNIFVKILETEFKFFNSCIYLKPIYLKSTGNKLALRNLIIESLIKVTRHFTIGPYEKLIKAQDNTKFYLNSKRDNDNNIYMYSYDALKIESISYDVIDPSLVAFNNDGNSLTIITTTDEESKENKYLQRLYNSQNIEYLKKYGKILGNKYLLQISKSISKIPKEELIKLKDKNNRESNIDNILKIMEGDDDEEENIDVIEDKKENKEKKEKLNINNRPSLISEGSSFELEEINNDQKKEIPKLKTIRDWTDKEILEQLLSFLNVNGLSNKEIKEIIGNYIYTPDNFIKVILILMRLRAKVPVIMMGETGCGKTALIRMAYNLKNKNKNPMKYN